MSAYDSRTGVANPSANVIRSNSLASFVKTTMSCCGITDKVENRRVAFALSLIWVIGLFGVNICNRSRPYINYYDILIKYLFINYRDLMLEITLNPIMSE